MMHERSDCTFFMITKRPERNIGEAYAFLMKYADQNGYTVAGLARECYIDGIWNKESEEEWLTEIQLPIEDVTK